MAGKEHSILFALNASLNGNFKGTFNSAQQEFARLGKEIQSMNRLQSDISSYQKQQKAVQNTEAKLRNLEKQYDLIQKEIKETDGPTAGLEREQAKLEQRISDTTTALERQNQKLSATEQRLNDARVDTSNLSGESQRLAAQMRDLARQQEEAARGAQSFGGSVQDAFAAAQQALVSAGIATGLREICDAYAECVSVAADFESSMSNVEALSGSTTQEMAELTAAAKELGATTKFTAQQSADAMGYMAMAGWDAQQMMAGMDGVINLAAAAGEDLAQVSDIVTDNLTAFGLTAADTAHFSDVLAAAATNSNTSVSIMGETFKQSAAIAGSLGYSIEDVAVGVGLMANAGVKGSIAGTALKNTFNGLLEGATLTAAAFGEYEFSAIKADGTMKDFAGTIDELRVYFDQMTEAERVNNAMAIAGKRGYNGLLAILNATDADYQSLTASINNCTGAAKRMADIKMDNLRGQLTLMDSAMEAVKTTIGEQFNPELRRLAEIGTDVLTWVNDFIQAHPAMTKGVMTFTGVMGAATVAITGVNAALKIFQALNVAALFTGPVGAVLGVAAAVAGVTAAVVGMTTALDDGIPSVKELTEAASEMQSTLESSAAAYDDASSSALAAANVADTYIDKLEAMGDSASLSEDEHQQYQNTLALLLQTIPSLSDCISQTTDEYGRTTYVLETSTNALRANADAWKKNAMAQAYQERLTAMYAAQADVLIEAEKNSVELTRAQTSLEQAEKKRSETLSRMNELQEEMGDAGADPDAVRAMQYEYDQLSASLGDIENEIWSAQKAEEVYTQAIAEGADAAAAAQEEMSLLEEAFRRSTGAVDEQTAALPELSNALDPVQERLMELAESYDNVYKSAYANISGQIGLFDEMKVKVDTSVSDMISSLESQINYMATYSENLRKAAEMGLSEGLLSQLSDGSTQSAAYLQAIVNSGQAKIEELNAAFAQVQEGKESFSGTVAEIQVGLNDAMTEMEQAVRDGVDAMELPDEAAQSARETIQAFIDQADKMQPWVQNAFAQLGNAAANALGLDLRNTSRGHSGDAGDHAPGAYASGTNSAPPGWAWVGEEGPELIRMRGGETVLPAEVSREYAILTAYGNQVGAYAGGTGNAPAAMAEVAKLTKISNAAYTNYSEAVYNAGAYNAISRSDYTAYASPRDAIVSAIGSAETASVPVPTSDNGSFGPAKVEIHIHIDGNATPETVQALEDYVRRGEIQGEFEKAWERMQADARRKDWF